MIYEWVENKDKKNHQALSYSIHLKFETAPIPPGFLSE